MPRKDLEARVFANLAIRLDPDVRTEAKQLAIQTGVSLNAYVEEALRQHNQRMKKAAKRDQQQLEMVSS